MKHLKKLPPQFKRYAKMGGVLDFAVFADCNGSDEEILAAFGSTLPSRYEFKPEVLRGLGHRRISERKFFGDWYDFDQGHLLKLGHHSTAGGSQLVDPALKKLDGVKIISGTSHVPEIGEAGQFAYAFSEPPYSLSGRPSETQSIFESIRDFVLPPEEPGIIYDRGNKLLPTVSTFFEAGSEWWGMFLFSVYIPATHKLTIIAGSTTD